MWASHGVFPSRPAHNTDLQSSRSTHEQESSQHMAAVASYLASLSPSPSPLVTSIHMCSPSFLSLSPPFRPLGSPALSISLSYPSLLPSLPSLATSLLSLSHYFLLLRGFSFVSDAEITNKFKKSGRAFTRAADAAAFRGAGGRESARRRLGSDKRVCLRVWERAGMGRS